jgi:hypothetical protein
MALHLLVGLAAASAVLEQSPPVGPNPIYEGETIVKKVNSTAVRVLHGFYCHGVAENGHQN